MSDIIKETEAHVDYKQELKCINNKNVDNTTMLAYTASNISNTIDIKAIIFTKRSKTLIAERNW